MKIKSDRRDIILMIVAVLILGLSGMWMLRAATPFGLGLNTDSVYYVNGARNILAGDGFTRTSGEGLLKPITHFPPLFSLVLAFVGLGGLDPLRGGRLVIILLYGANSMLFAWLIWKMTHRSLPTFVGTLLIAFSFVNLETSSWLMSEPLYLFLMVISFLVAHYYMKDWKPVAILGLGVLSGLMYLTRYVGVSMIITWLAVILLFTPGWRRKATHSGILLLSSLPFVIGIMLRNYRLTGSTGNRTFIVHWASFEKIADGIQTFWSWILPYGSRNYYDSLRLVFIITFFILLLAGLAFLVRGLFRHLKNPRPAVTTGLLLTLALNGIIYLAGVLVAMNFFDATTVLDDRMLLPIYWIAVLFLSIGISRLWEKVEQGSRNLLAGMLVLILGFTLYGSIITVGDLKQDGQGFIDRYRRESQTMQYIREHDIDLFYTNTPPPVYILTGKAGYMVPTPYDSLTLQTRESYQADLAAMKEKIVAQGGLLIFFFETGFETDPWYLELTAGLEAKVRTTDGIIWGRVE